MLKKANLSWNARQLARNIGKGEVVFDHSVQRGLVWDLDRKSLLIHSMIEGYPIPEMFAVNEDNFSILEGKQRCNCIYDYLNDKFSLANVPDVTLEDGTVIDVNGKKFSELSEEIQDIINNYSLVIHYFEDITDDEISELFFRINYGKPLSAIEMSRVRAKCLTTIQEIGKHELFTAALTEKAFEKYTHEDLVIKSYIMLNHKNPCYDTKYVRPVMETAEFTEEDINKLNLIFDRILEVYKRIASDNSVETGKLSKKIAKRVITRTHMLSIIPITMKSINDDVDIELFTLWVKSFFCGKKSPTKYDRYNSNATSGSGHVEAVKARLEVVKSDYTKYMKNHQKSLDKMNKEEKENVETIKEVENVIGSIPENINEEVSVDNFDPVIEDMEDEIPDKIKSIIESTEEEMEDLVEEPA